MVRKPINAGCSDDTKLSYAKFSRCLRSRVYAFTSSAVKRFGCVMDCRTLTAGKRGKVPVGRV